MRLNKKKLVMDIIENAATYPKSQNKLEKELSLTAAVLNSAVKKKVGWLKRLLRFTVIH